LKNFGCDEVGIGEIFGNFLSLEPILHLIAIVFGDILRFRLEYISKYISNIRTFQKFTFHIEFCIENFQKPHFSELRKIIKIL